MMLPSVVPQPLITLEKPYKKTSADPTPPPLNLGRLFVKKSGNFLKIQLFLQKNEILILKKITKYVNWDIVPTPPPLDWTMFHFSFLMASLSEIIEVLNYLSFYIFCFESALIVVKPGNVVIVFSLL